MAEEKVKVRELVDTMGVPSKEALRALHSLKLSAKSLAGSVTLEEADRLRSYFAERKNEIVETTSVQPNVIVRRRKKEAVPPPPREETAPAADEVKVAEPIAEKPASEPVEKPREKETPKPARPARVISRPGDEKPKETPPEQPKPAEPKKPERVGKTLAEEIREREAAERAKAREEANELKRKIERGASIIHKPELIQPAPAETEVQASEPVSEPASEPVAEPTREEAAAETVAQVAESAAPRAGATRARGAKPDASATPSGSSAPAFGRAEESEEKKAEGARVRIISLPTQPPAQRRPRPGVRADTGRGDSRGGARPPFEGRQGAPRAASPGGFTQERRPGASQPPINQGADGRDGQSKKKRLKGRRTVDFPQGDFGRRSEDDASVRFNRGKAKRKPAKAQPQAPITQPVKAAKRKIRVADAIRVADMAHQLGLKANEIIKVLFNLGVMATINQALDFDTATLVASEFGYEVEKAGFSEEDYLAPKETDAPESLKPRPPVVTIMGHVDHGKTSLLDAVRKSNIISGEAGGITQHIGAYHVRTKRGEIVFLDTPGHEAFTAMRARGAQVTDLVVLVVAADDGVMEQTREAISHARAADVPILVAVNKMDKPGADPDRVLRELSELGLQPEDWGGDTIVAKVSAKTREGLDDFLEMVALQSEIMDLKANPDKPARGHIVEAKLDKGRGPVATVLVQEGTLHTGDNFVCGPFAGRVRALTNDQGKKVKEAGPSLPVEVQGFDGVPEAGEEFLVVADDKLARRIADTRAIKRRERALASEARVTLETFLAQGADEETPTLNLVLKADVQGSLEAISEALRKQSGDKVKINIVHGGAGAISESDILLASASRAIIIGFNVRPSSKIKDIAERENVDIRFYDIIYKLVDDVKSAMAGLLAPVEREVYLGQAEVRQVYHLPKVGSIAGSYVSDGKIARNAGARLLRDGIVVYTGKIASLKRFKDDMREVVKGNECGIGLENYNDIKAGDILEAFETVEEAATL